MKIISKEKIAEALDQMIYDSYGMGHTRVVAVDIIKAMKRNLEAGLYETYYDADDLYFLFDDERKKENEDEDDK